MDEILREGSHYNVPKIHLISYFAEQIPKFGSLLQYSTDITEYMHKAFKDAYRRSNKVDSLSQIVTTYTRDHTFAMKDLTIRAWKSIQQQADTIACVREKPTGSQVYFKLLGKTNMVLNPRDLEHKSGVHDLRLAIRAFFIRELRGTNSDTERLFNHEIGAYGALQIPVPKLSDQGLVLHHARCSGDKRFRGGKRNDWVWVKRYPALDTTPAGTLNGLVPGRLDAFFKLTSKSVVYRLAYVTLLNCVGVAALQGAEGMLRVGFTTREAGVVIPIAKIEGVAHLIPLEPDQSWLVNNRIDVET